MSNRERLYEPIEITEEYLDGKGHPITMRLGRREDGTLLIYASEGGAYWRLDPDAAKELLAQLSEALAAKSPSYGPYYVPSWTTPYKITCGTNTTQYQGGATVTSDGGEAPEPKAVGFGEALYRTATGTWRTDKIGAPPTWSEDYKASVAGTSCTVDNCQVCGKESLRDDKAQK
jgi:hypothetical protein